MKIPVDHVELSPLGYENYWVDFPRSVKEGWLYDFQKLNDNRKVVNEEGRADADMTRAAMLHLLALVPAWNLDDEKGTILPLVKDTKDAKGCTSDGIHAEDCPKLPIVREIPLDVIMHLTEHITQKMSVKEETAGFSKTS